MQKIIDDLRSQPQTTLPLFEPHLSTWFLLDRIRGKKTLTGFYQDSNADVIASIDCLLQNTEHDHLLEVSPLLIKLNHTHLSKTLYQHIQEERSGIFIQSKNEHISAHLQYLFIMQSDIEGDVYTRYYDPILWSVLQLSLTDQLESIWGILDKVYTLTPDSHSDKLNYYTWTHPNSNKITTGNSNNPIQLASQFYETNEIVQLLYFTYEAAYLESIEITDNQLLHTLLNLQELGKYGLQSNLQKLLKQCVAIPCFSTNPTVQKILQSNMDEFEKTQQLVELT